MVEYKLMWNSEVIDTADTEKEARFLCNEYNLAFNGGVYIK